MTAEENERRQREHRIFLYSNARKIKKVFPTINRIEISYVIEHKCVYGNTKKGKTLNFTPESEDIFVIACLNSECSSFGYDLKNGIRTMIRDHKTEQKGELHCEGQEAPDHPEQSCGGSLKYTINIFYK